MSCVPYDNTFGDVFQILLSWFSKKYVSSIQIDIAVYQISTLHLLCYHLSLNAPIMKARRMRKRETTAFWGECESSSLQLLTERNWVCCNFAETFSRDGESTDFEGMSMNLGISIFLNRRIYKAWHSLLCSSSLRGRPVSGSRPGHKPLRIVPLCGVAEVNHGVTFLRRVSRHAAFLTALWHSSITTHPTVFRARRKSSVASTQWNGLYRNQTDLVHVITWIFGYSDIQSNGTKEYSGSRFLLNWACDFLKAHTLCACRETNLFTEEITSIVFGRNLRHICDVSKWEDECACGSIASRWAPPDIQRQYMLNQ